MNSHPHPDPRLRGGRLFPRQGGRGKLKRAAWDDSFLKAMLLQFANFPMR